MLMITHLLFQILDKFKVGSLSFRKILAVFLGLMIFALIFTAVKFLKIEIPNFNRNIIMLAAIDLGGVFFLVWKKTENKEISENVNQELPPSNIPQQSNKNQVQFNDQVEQQQAQFYQQQQDDEQYDEQYDEKDDEQEQFNEKELEQEQVQEQFDDQENQQLQEKVDNQE